MTDVMAPLYRALCNAQALYLDVVGYADLRGCEQLLHEFAAHTDTYRAHFKLGGYKTFLDGSPQASTAWMRTPYANAADGYTGRAAAAPCARAGSFWRTATAMPRLSSISACSIKPLASLMMRRISAR